MKLKMRLLAFLLVVVTVVGFCIPVNAIPVLKVQEDRVVNDNTVKVTTGITYYYLTDTYWCDDVEIRPVRYIESDGDFIVNKTKISPKNEQGEWIENITIYAHPGTAIGFDSSTYSEFGSYTAPVHADDRPFRWLYDGDATTNYYVIDRDINTDTIFTFKLYSGNPQTTGVQVSTVTVNVIPENAAPTLVPRDQVRTIDVTLYNYNGKAFNDYYVNKNQNALIFANNSMGVTATPSSYAWRDSSNLPNGSNVSTGIMQKKLVNGLPHTYHPQNTDFFSTDTMGGAKEVFQNVAMEFIYEPSTAYYYYSSNLNHAQFFENEKRIKLYNETLAPQYIYSPATDDQMDNAGFYPFADIHKAFRAYGGSTADYRPWSIAELKKDYFQQEALFVQDFEATSGANSNMDMHFGLQMEVPFYLPIGRQNDANNDGVKEDLIYSFTGDDDLWVYVDDELVLDIGGAHTAINGVINFTQQTVTVSSSADVAYEGGTYVVKGGSGARTWSFSELGVDGLKFEEDQMHTMKVFYLERWSGVSNCRMIFNLPVVPKNSVIVSKSVLNQDGEVPSVNPDDTYNFEVYTQKDGANATLFKTFDLKDGEYEVVEGIESLTDVYVVEKNPNGRKYTYQSATVTVKNGEQEDTQTYQLTDNDIQTISQEMRAESQISFSFLNTIVTSDIEVEKKLGDFAEVVSDSTEYDFNVKIDGNSYNDYKLNPNGNFVVENVPNGMTYEVTELDLPTPPSGYEYIEPSYTNESGTLAGDVKVTVTNDLIALYGNLMITKNGIQNVDNHNVSDDGKQKEEKQSTIFNISGTSNSGVKIDMDVVIHGNNSVTVNQIPVGTYTVTEKTGWSWRYNPDHESQSVTVESAQTPEITFVNTRTESKWLSGDNFFRNLFNGQN